MSFPIQIVLAEDNPADVYLVREALSNHGIDSELYVIGDGEQAIRFIERTDASLSPVPDLVLLDLHLPKHDGEEILQRLRGSESCGRIPIVILTSSDSPQHRAMTEKHAGVYYFLKPAGLDEFRKLGTVVKLAVAKAKAQSANGD